MHISSKYPIDNFVESLYELPEIKVKYPANEIGRRAAADIVTLLGKINGNLEVIINGEKQITSRDSWVTIELKETSGIKIEEITTSPTSYTKLTNGKSIGVISRELDNHYMNNFYYTLSKELNVGITKHPYDIAFSYYGGLTSAPMFFSPETEISVKHVGGKTFNNRAIAEKKEYKINDKRAFEFVREPLYWDYWGTMYAAAFNALAGRETIKELTKRKGLRNYQTVQKHLAISIAKVLSTISGTDIEDILKDVHCPKRYRGLVIKRWASARRFIYENYGREIIDNYNMILSGQTYVLENIGFTHSKINEILDDFYQTSSNHEAYKINTSDLKAQLDRNKKPYNE